MNMKVGVTRRLLEKTLLLLRNTKIAPQIIFYMFCVGIHFITYIIYFYNKIKIKKVSVLQTGIMTIFERVVLYVLTIYVVNK